jgi:O-antigen/teichoic acid export membrane protein
MIQSIKRLARHSLVYGIGHIVSRSLGFLLLPIHTNVLLPEEYRIPALLFSSLAILNVIFSYGMDVAFLRFFILEEDGEKKRNIFSTAFWMILASGVCFSTVMIIFPSSFSQIIFRSAHHLMLIRMAGIILLTDALCLIPFLVLRAEEQSTRFVVLKTLNIIVNMGLNILFVVILKKGVPGIFLANVIASLFTLVTLSPVLIRWLRPRFQSSALGELLRFGLPYIPSGLAVIIMDQIGRFFLDRMIGEEATGIFSASYKLGMFMALVVAAFRFAWHPYFLSTSKNKDAPRVFARILTYFLAAMGFVYLILVFFIDDLITIRLFGVSLLGRGYGEGLAIVPVVLLAYIAYGVYIHFIVGVYLKKKTIWMPLATGIGAFVALIANWLLVPHLNIMGAAWASFLAYAAMAITMYLINRRLYPIPYEWQRLTKLILIYTLIFFAGTQFFSSHSLIHILLLAAVMPLLWIVRFFSQDERAIIRSWLHKK